MWKLKFKLLTPENIEELKRDCVDWRTVKPLFKSPANWWETVKGNIERVHSVEQDETCSRFFFQKVHKESSVLSSLMEEDGSVTSSQSDILRISKSFYARLYDTKPTDSAASQSFLASITEVLDDSTWERLDQSLSLDELTKALESSEKNKTPRSDGLLAQLYSALWNLIGQDLLEVCDCMLLGSTMKKGIITLIQKQKGEREEIRNWQPISLLNADYKILFKVIVNWVRLISICDQFELALEAEVNRGKSGAMFFENWADRSFIPFTIMKDYLMVLGIWCGGAGPSTKAWEEHIAKVKQKLVLWEHRSLSIVGYLVEGLEKVGRGGGNQQIRAVDAEIKGK
eukprot:g39045.t1